MQWDTRQKNLLLILARDVASKLATPAFLVDAVGTLVFFNEAAESVLGHTFAEIGELPAEEWMKVWEPMDDRGEPISVRELPLGVALFDGQPDHRTLRIRSGDGQTRSLAATGIPLLSHPDELVGALALFWEAAPPPADPLAEGV
ncbi:MAG: PAS domain-containing protein [Actinomycetota bacterium]|nr:PAS domain-containing protein [Actinomycetota bacterium]